MGVTIACNGAGSRVGLEINASRAGPLMRSVMPQRDCRRLPPDRSLDLTLALHFRVL